MRTGGFPCRLEGCLRTFQVLDQRSMDCLRAASAARTDRELHMTVPVFGDLVVRPGRARGAQAVHGALIEHLERTQAAFESAREPTCPHGPSSCRPRPRYE